MAKIISIHSFRGGTGKSNMTANVSALLAAQGLRVAVVDTDVQSPGIHVLLGVNQEKLSYALNDYLWGRCEIKQAAHDVTDSLDAGLRGSVLASVAVGFAVVAWSRLLTPTERAEVVCWLGTVRPRLSRASASGVGAADVGPGPENSEPILKRI